MIELNDYHCDTCDICGHDSISITYVETEYGRCAICPSMNCIKQFNQEMNGDEN